MAFLACETQWRVSSGMGGSARLGLDYAAVDVLLRRAKLDDDAFEGLLIMERAALDAFSEIRAMED